MIEVIAGYQDQEIFKGKVSDSNFNSINCPSKFQPILERLKLLSDSEQKVNIEQLCYKIVGFATDRYRLESGKQFIQLSKKGDKICLECRLIDNERLFINVLMIPDTFSGISDFVKEYNRLIDVWI